MPRLRRLEPRSGILVMPAAAFAVHQLRYWLAYGSRANSELAAQGHSYLNSLVPWTIFALAVGARVSSCAASRTRARGRQHAPTGRLPGWALWLATWAGLLAIYATQETLESFLVNRPPRRHGGCLRARGLVGRSRRRRGRGARRRAASARPRVLLRLATTAPRRRPGVTRFTSRTASQRRSSGRSRAPPRVARLLASSCPGNREGRGRRVAQEVVRVRKRYVAPLLACLTLAVPASASAHARTATVALDYRLVLDPASRTLDGVRVGILDGDRDLRITARTATRRRARRPARADAAHRPQRRVGESRIGDGGRRASSSTSGSGWQKVGGIHVRVARPSPRPAAVRRWPRSEPSRGSDVPIRVDGRPAAISGSFVRYQRPELWPWLAGGGRRLRCRVRSAPRAPRLRPLLTIALGAVAGLAAIASLASFGVADSPTGRVAWVSSRSARSSRWPRRSGSCDCRASGACCSRR